MASVLLPVQCHTSPTCTPPGIFINSNQTGKLSSRQVQLTVYGTLIINILPYANESHVSHVEPSTSKPVEMGLLAETYFRGYLSGDIGLYVLPVCVQVNIKISYKRQSYSVIRKLATETQETARTGCPG